MTLLTQLWRFSRTRRKLWLMPVIMMLLVFGALLIVAQTPVIAPFIYSLF